MTKDLKQQVTNFRLPRYDEIPNVGLYLEQLVKYVNEFVAPLGDVAITASMVSNYVKMKLIESPARKQYSREQIAQLFMITLSKTVVSLDNVRLVLAKASQYDARTCYDYFVAEFENLLLYVFDVKDVADDLLPDTLPGAELIRNLLLTSANKIYLDQCFAAITADAAAETPAEE